MKREMDHDPKASGDDGEWVMQWSDFCRNFRTVYVCRIYKPVSDGGEWHVYHTPGQWKGETAGGCSNTKAVLKNPQYYLQVSEPCTVFLSLRVQEEEGTGREYEFAIGAVVIDNGGKRMRYNSDIKLRTGSFTFAREVSVEGQLKPESSLLTVCPSTFSAGEEARFTLTVISRAPLDPACLDGTKLKLIPT